MTNQWLGDKRQVGGITQVWFQPFKVGNLQPTSVLYRTNIYMGVSKNRDIPKMDGENNGNPDLKWMIWGYPYFRKHPHINNILSRILTWKSDFGLFGLGFHDDSFVHISQKRALDEFHVSKTNEKKQ